MTSPAQVSPAATAPRPRRKRWLRVLLWILGVLLALVLIVVIAFQVSPWPSALVIRYAFDKNGAETNEKLAADIPAGVAAMTNQKYRDHDADALLDVYFPEDAASSGEALPTVVWTHGGGWVSGSKKQVASYAQILAGHGYTVIAIDYSIAPGAKYPTPLHELDDALTYVVANAERFHVDLDQIVLAGDSAGSQIAAQVANAIVSPEYAELTGLDPAISAKQLVGTVLNCGAYDLAMVDTSAKGAQGWFLRSVLWAYTGSKNPESEAKFDPASVINYVTKDFPPTYITGGNDDPLTPQGQAFAKKLEGAGVDVDALFYPSDYTPALPHEYQFNLSTDAGKDSLQRTIAFLAKHTKP